MFNDGHIVEIELGLIAVYRSLRFVSGQDIVGHDFIRCRAFAITATTTTATATAATTTAAAVLRVVVAAFGCKLLICHRLVIDQGCRGINHVGRRRHCSQRSGG